MALRFLHTNDFHGKLTSEKFEHLKRLREEADVYVDCGDAILTGNLGIPLKPDPVWPLFKALDLTAGVPGNRESHVLAPAFRAKLAGNETPLLCANLRAKQGDAPLPGHLIHEIQGIKIGFVGAMVEMVTPKMKTQAASAYLWDPAIPTLLHQAEALRPKVDLLIALTHIGYRRDLELAETGAYDIVFGGHSHTVLDAPERHGKAWICQGGSHGRFAGQYAWDGHLLTGGLTPL